MGNKYDVEHFIAKFEAIPVDNWTVETFTAYEGCHCALGHCGAVLSWSDTPESKALNKLFRKYLGKDAAQFNDDHFNEHVKGNTPKARILNALQSIRELAND